MKLRLEATINDIRHHNSKLGDDSWVDITVRVAGQANIEAAMLMHRAKEKTAKIEFEVEEIKKDED